MSRSLFFYPGRKDSKKASIYVKDLVSIMVKMVDNANPGVTLYNCCYPKPHTIEEICTTMSKITSLRKPNILIPAGLLKVTAYFILILGKLIGKSLMGIHPDRVKKIIISTNIIGEKLNKEYPLQFSLKEAITDWYNDCANKGLY